jgi:hypothetical protein
MSSEIIVASCGARVGIRHSLAIPEWSHSDLCTRNQKIFAHEHTLFTQSQLQGHIEYGEDATNKPSTSIATPSGFTGHPACDFCRVNYYDADELFKHCRERHEQCFVCVRSGAGRMDYYLDYPALERHFENAHYYCAAAECKEKKFVVFETLLDLQAHQIEVHGADAGNKQANRAARRVETRFTYENDRPGPSRGPPAAQAEASTSNPRAPPAPNRPTFVSVGREGSIVMQPGRQIPGLGPPRSARQQNFGGNLSNADTAPQASASRAQPARPSRPTSPKRHVNPEEAECVVVCACLSPRKI